MVETKAIKYFKKDIKLFHEMKKKIPSETTISQIINFSGGNF